MRLGKFDLPPQATMPMQGVATWENPGNQFHVFLLHYSADPEKRSLQWEQMARAGFGDGDWDQEMELDFGSWTGLPVFRRFSRALHIAKAQIPWVPHINWPILMGWDIGIHACVWAQRYRDQFNILAAQQITGAFEDKKFGTKYRDFEVDCSGLGTFIDHCMATTKEMFGDTVTLKHIADPAARHHTIVREEKPVDIFRKKGISLSYGTTQDTRVRVSAVEDWLKLNTNEGTPAFQVDPGALLVIDGMSGGYAYDKHQKPDKGPFSHCVVGDTQIATPSGSKAIAEIRVGDLVLTPQGACRVSATMSQVVDCLVDIQYTGGGHLTATENHPIILGSGERCRADALRPGQSLVGGTTVWGDQPFMRSKNLGGFAITASRAATVPPRVSVLDMQPHSGQRRVYDLTVDDAHCFYANGILVGNCCNIVEYISTLYPAANASKSVLDQYRRKHAAWDSETLGQGFQTTRSQRRLPEDWIS